MLPGPKQAAAGPGIEPPPDKPDHRGQLARLIRERPVLVNRAADHLGGACTGAEWDVNRTDLPGFSAMGGFHLAFNIGQRNRNMSDP